jgi:hypothetical protein
VELLRVQTVGEVSYFQVRLKSPAKMIAFRDTERRFRGQTFEATANLAPRLLSPDAKASHIVGPHGSLNRDRRFFDKKEREDESPERSNTDSLMFLGRCDGKSTVTLTLQYPTPGKHSPLIGKLIQTSPPPIWLEKTITLDFAKAKKVSVPKEAKERRNPAKKLESKNVDEKDVKKGDGPPGSPGGVPGGIPGGGGFPGMPGFNQQPGLSPDDLEAHWALEHARAFRSQRDQVASFGYFSFAARAIERKYGLASGNLEDPQDEWRFRGSGQESRLYDLTTGAAAMAETMQLRRMTRLGSAENEPRTIPVEKLPRIEVASHPWKKMMGDKKPASELMAMVVPEDNYYVRFARIDKMAAFAQVLGAWGGNLLNSYELTSRDGRYWQRYERQLCLNLESLVKPLLGEVISEIALTGSDAYLREGSDLTVLFRVAQEKKFASAILPGIEAARKAMGDKLTESESEHEGVKIRSLVSPLREVSLHRASLGEVEAFSNSLAGLHRLIDTHKGKRKRLGDALDFQYMRTVFRADDKSEDGFAFLSDPFIRNLVGPATKIKQRRRFEALTSLHMLTNGAMFSSWEASKPAQTIKDIFDHSTLSVGELTMPEGKPVAWDGERQTAVSDAYGTIHFATPLVEIPIEKVTKTEEQEYRRFHQEYLGLWRQFFDPMGFRVNLEDGKLKFDTYILPLIENSSYNQLRRLVGSGTVKLTPDRLSSKTLFQWMAHLSNDADIREGFFGLGPNGPNQGPDALGLWLWLGWAVDPVGEWLLLRVDDGPSWGKLMNLYERQMLGHPVSTQEIAKQIWSLPVAVGVDLKNSLTAATALGAARTSILTAAPGMVTWAPLDKEYNGVSIVRIQATERGLRNTPLAGLFSFRPAIYYAVIDGALYLTLNEEMMKSLIDDANAKKDPKAKTIEVATSLHLSTGAAKETRGLLKSLLERDVAERARTSEPLWHALYSSGVIPADASPQKATDEAYRYLGFVPVSPDGSLFKWNAKSQEVVNDRYGSRRVPIRTKTLAETSRVNQLFESLDTIRADLKFREDGIHTVLWMKMRK